MSLSASLWYERSIAILDRALEVMCGSGGAGESKMRSFEWKEVSVEIWEVVLILIVTSDILVQLL